MQETFDRFWAGLQELSQYSSFWIACAVGIVVILFLWWYLTRPAKAICAYDHSGGRVWISRKAIEDLVNSTCRRLDGVKRVRSTVGNRGEHVFIKVKLCLDGSRGSYTVNELSQALQGRMRTILEEELSIRQLEDIDIWITGIKNPPSIQSQSNTKVESAPPFGEFEKAESDFLEVEDSSR